MLMNVLIRVINYDNNVINSNRKFKSPVQTEFCSGSFFEYNDLFIPFKIYKIICTIYAAFKITVMSTSTCILYLT